MLVLSWNLFHGRALPPLDRNLIGAFSAKLAAWRWDVALLQEVPPWWPVALARACGAEQRTAMTSRNSLLALRRGVAERRPELIKSNGGGCNAVLARVPIVAHRSLRLRVWPERRVAQLVRLGNGACVANFHGSTRVPLAEQELSRLCDAADAWAGESPLVIGGDLNLRAPLAAGDAIALLASRDVDHILARGLTSERAAQVLDRHAFAYGRRVELSDHPPLRAALVRLATGSDPAR